MNPKLLGGQADEHGSSPAATSPPFAEAVPAPAVQRANRKVDQLLRRALSDASSRSPPSTNAYRPLHPVPVALPTIARPGIGLRHNNHAGYRHPNGSLSPLSPSTLITSPDSVTSPLASPRSPHDRPSPSASPARRFSSAYAAAASPITPKAVGQLRRPSVVHAGSPQRTVISEPSPAVSLIGSITAASTAEMGEGEVAIPQARQGPGLIQRLSRGISYRPARGVRGYAMQWWWKQRAFDSSGFPLVVGVSSVFGICSFISSVTTFVVDAQFHSPTTGCTLARVYLILSACLGLATFFISLVAYSLHRKHQFWWSHVVSKLVTATTSVFSPKTSPRLTVQDFSTAQQPPNSPSTLSSFATSLPASIAPTPPPSPTPEPEPPTSAWITGVIWLLALVRIVRLLSIGLGAAAVILLVSANPCRPLVVGTWINLTLVALHIVVWLLLLVMTFINLPRALYLQSKLAHLSPVGGPTSLLPPMQNKLSMHFRFSPWSKHTAIDDIHVVQWYPSSSPSPAVHSSPQLQPDPNHLAASPTQSYRTQPLLLRPSSAPVPAVAPTTLAVPQQPTWASQLDPNADMCPICLGAFVQGDTLARVPTHTHLSTCTSNVYHLDCLLAWPHQDACPDCGVACHASPSSAPSVQILSNHLVSPKGPPPAAAAAATATEAPTLTRQISTRSKRSAVFIRDYWLGVAPSASAAAGEYALAVPRPSTDAEAWAEQVLNVAAEMRGWTWTPGNSREASVEIGRGEWEGDV